MPQFSKTTQEICIVFYSKTGKKSKFLELVCEEAHQHQKHVPFKGNTPITCPQHSIYTPTLPIFLSNQRPTNPLSLKKFSSSPSTTSRVTSATVSNFIVLLLLASMAVSRSYADGLRIAVTVAFVFCLMFLPPEPGICFVYPFL